ncbi:MAG: DUF4160 domain-containing protein [Clostridiales bacterium]|jgi:hypothetical protein|nr:DUF4160 domain-containing protein [Clostridiales bacterium]
MPSLANFSGMLFRMNWEDVGQHNIPHFHVFYQGYEAVFDFDGNLLAGHLPKSKSKSAKSWAKRNKVRLEEKWYFAVNKINTDFRIGPFS